MRAHEFIRESDQNLEEIWSTIQNDCRPYINEIGGIEKFFEVTMLHGRKGSATNEGIVKVMCPVNRTPRNTPTVWHNAADEWFEDHTGIRFRSNALFGTGNFREAEGYGHGSHEIMVPIGQFSYCWSEAVDDMTTVLERATRYDDESDEDFVAALLEEGNYLLNSRLEDAIKSRNEIMVNCQFAYLINPLVFRRIKSTIVANAN